MRTRVLRYLGVLGTDEEANSQDALIVDEAIDAARQELILFGLGNIQDSSGKYADWAQNGVRDYIAGAVSNYFGIDQNRRMEFDQRRTAGLQLLYRLSEQYRKAEPIESRYF